LRPKMSMLRPFAFSESEEDRRRTSKKMLARMKKVVERT